MSSTNKPFCVLEFYAETGLMQAMARSQCFANIKSFLAVLFAIWIGLEIDFNDSVSPSTFDIHYLIFFFGFAGNWAILFGAFRHKRDFLKCADLIWDTVLLVLMLGRVVAGFTGGAKGLLAFLDPVVLCGRVMQLGGHVPELAIIVKAIMVSFRSVFFVLLLMVVSVYIWAITFRKWALDTHIGAMYFPNVPEAMHSLWVHGVMIGNQPEFAERLREESIGLEVLYMIFLIQSVVLLVLFFGVVCEVVSAVAASEKDNLVAAYMQGCLATAMESNGWDSAGTLSKAEFDSILMRPEVARVLQQIGVNPFTLLDCRDDLFRNGVEPSWGEFAEFVHSIKDDNSAKFKDIAWLKRQIDAKLLTQGTAQGAPVPSNEAPTSGSAFGAWTQEPTVLVVGKPESKDLDTDRHKLR